MKKETSWLSVAVDVHQHSREAIGQFLFQAGAVGLMEENDQLIAYFPSTVDTQGLQSSLDRYLSSLESLGLGQKPQVMFDKIPHQDWNAEWKKNYHGFKVCSNIFIKPSWEPWPKETYKCIIEIDPEMAFGTGTHETTRLCLQAIESAIRGGEFVLDIGTGTGILAIAAVKLGAHRAVAFDIDPIAVTTAVKNAEKNRVIDKILFYTGVLSAIHPKKIHADIILANVNRVEIVNMLPLIVNLMEPKTQAIFSGLLEGEHEKMKTAFATAGLKIMQSTFANEWMTFQCIKE